MGSHLTVWEISDTTGGVDSSVRLLNSVEGGVRRTGKRERGGSQRGRDPTTDWKQTLQERVRGECRSVMRKKFFTVEGTLRKGQYWVVSVGERDTGM